MPNLDFRFRLIAFALACTASFAQTQPAPTPATAIYDIVSIHLHDPNDSSGHVMAMNDHYDAAGSSLKELLMAAYGVTTFDQVIGIPASLSDASFDILAKPDADTVAMLEKLSREDGATAHQHMMRTLLEQRFALRAHTESRELPIYLLEIAKGGPRLKPAELARIPNISKDADGKFHGGGMLQVQYGGMAAQGIDAEMLARNLQFQAHRIIHDQTGLTGRYDFTLTWNPDPMNTTADTSKPDLFTALQEQLGLKLTPGKAPETVVVVDHVEAPTPN